MIEISISKTLDWGSMNYEKFASMQEQKVYQDGRVAGALKSPHEDIFRLIRLWDDAFNISYFEYRSEMKKIAEENLSDVLDSTAPITHIMRIDDDDWISPNVKQIKCKSKKADLYWSVILGGCWYPIRNYTRTYKDPNLETGNHATPKEHRSGRFKEFVPDVYTYFPKTPSSLSNLMKVSDRTSLIDLFEYYMESDQSIPDEGLWAEKYLRMLSKIDNKMKVRKLF